MSDTLTGDPFHEGGSQPMDSLKGGMIGPNTQAPMTSSNSGNSMGGANDTAPGTGAWSSTSLAPSAGKNGTNDKNQAH